MFAGRTKGHPMNAFEKAQALGLTGTDVEIVARLKMLTVSDIAVAAVRTWFREQELWMQRSNGQMYGPLQTAYDSAQQAQKDALDYLYDAVFGGSATSLRTTEKDWSKKTWDIVQLIVALLPDKAGLVDSFYALDGGRPYKDIDEPTYAAQKTAAQAASALAAIDQAYATEANETIQPALTASNRTKASIATALETAAANLRA